MENSCVCGFSETVTKIENGTILYICKGCGRVRSKRSWLD